MRGRNGDSDVCFHPYENENQKWYKAAKKAEKKSGAPNVHLAL